MKKHQIAAIVVGVILAVVSFIPVIVTMNRYDLAHPNVVKVFLYPTIGVAVAAVIVFVSFLKD